MINYNILFGRLGNQMFQGAYLLAQVKKGMIPSIYVQGEEFFEEAREEVRALFSQGIKEPIDMVAIHVRRAANPTNPDEPKYCDNLFYVNLFDTDYYERAMDMFPDEDFIVFSDDIEWCKQQDIFRGCEFSAGKTDIEDMNLMAACKGIIMANSSFSFWAAYLNPNPDAKIIAPSVENWHPDGVERTVCPQGWTRI